MLTSHPSSSTSRARRTAGRLGPIALIAVGVLALIPTALAGAATAPLLGTAQSFAVLAGAGITNTGPTTITGDVGSFPTLTQSGFGSVTLGGTNHGGDAVTQKAKSDLVTAYNAAAAATPTTVVATELGGLTLTPGVYGSPTLGLTGTLTLNTLGDPNAVFIFKADSTLITASNSSVVVLGGATACNVYWQVGSSATLGTGTDFVGTVLADTSITANTGATVQGRLLAMDGAVTLDTNVITRTACAPPVYVPPAPAPTTTTTTPSTTTTTPGTTTTTTTTTVPGGAAGGADGGTTTDGPTPGGTTGPAGVVDQGIVPSGPAEVVSVATPEATATNLTGRPNLPVTGFDSVLPFLGIGAITVGVVLQAIAMARRSPRPAHLRDS